MLEKDPGEGVPEVWGAQDWLYDHNTPVPGIHQQMPKKRQDVQNKPGKFKQILWDLVYSHIPFSSKILKICI